MRVVKCSSFKSDVISVALWYRLMRTVGGGWQNFIHCLEAQRFARLVVSFIKGGYKEMNSVYIQVCLVTACVVTSNGVYLVIACLSWKQHATVNYVGPKRYNM